MESNIAIVLGVVVLLALAAAIMVFLRKRTSDGLRSRFGPEYERAIEAAGGRRKGQAELQQRQKRVRSFELRTLTSEESQRYAPLWEEVQTQFVDDPKAATLGADQLLAEVITQRGYPAGDFEQRVADLSVDHPGVVQGYRTAHDISARDADGEASTEDLRQALLCYRALFRELVGQPVVGEPIVEAPIEGAISPADADESTNAEPAPTEAAPAAGVAIDEPALAVQPDRDERRANVPEPIST